jgi:hypothetical protein
LGEEIVDYLDLEDMVVKEEIAGKHVETQKESESQAKPSLDKPPTSPEEIDDLEL